MAIWIIFVTIFMGTLAATISTPYHARSFHVKEPFCICSCVFLYSASAEELRPLACGHSLFSLAPSPRPLALLELFGLKFWRSGAVCQWVGHSERAAGDSEQVQMDVSFTKHFDQLIDQLKSVARSVAF